MLSVVVPTRNDESTLVPTLAALVPGVADGLVRDVTIADAGSTDATLEIADHAGCHVVGPVGARGRELDIAARRAKGPWLLFLEPDVTLEEGWRREVRALIEQLDRAGEAESRAAVFGFGVDGFGGRARSTERRAFLSRALTGLPRPEQGLLIHARFYEKLGGFRPLSAMAEADLIRRIGAGRIVTMRTKALAPASRREAAPSGPTAALCAGLLMLRVPPRYVARLYGQGA